jgi:hypothetical protein
MNDTQLGLSEGNQNFIATLVFVGLLIFGPKGSFGLIILIIIPIIILLILQHFGKKWNIDAITNDRLNRTLLALVASALFFAAYISYTANHHIECDQYIRTRDGDECVGDYVTVEGPNTTTALIEGLFAGMALWYSIVKRNEDR